MVPVTLRHNDLVNYIDEVWYKPASDAFSILSLN